MSKNATIVIPASSDLIYKTQCLECSHNRKKKKEPCLKINTQNGLYYCHHCLDKGLHENWRTNPLYHAPKEYMKEVDAMDVYLNDSWSKWVKSRCISVSTLKRFGVRTIEKNGNQVLCFPYMAHKQLVNLKFRTLDKKFFFDGNKAAGAQMTFFNFDRMAEVELDTKMGVRPGCVYVVEGEMDVLACYEAAPNKIVISFPTGASMSGVNENDSQAAHDAINMAWKILNEFEQVVIFVDNDERGKDFATKLQKLKNVFKLSKRPEDSKDANDILIKYGPEYLAKIMDHVEGYPVGGIFTAKDRYKEIMDLVENGRPPASDFKMGSELNRLYRWTHDGGKFYLITGIPGHGKSEFVSQLSLNLAIHYGHKTLHFSPEKMPLKLFFAEMCQKYIQKPYFGDGKMNSSEIHDAIEFLEPHFFVFETHEIKSMDWILEKAVETYFRFGIKWLVLDNWEYINQSFDLEHIKRYLLQLSIFSRSTGVNIMLVAHPHKMTKDKEGKHLVPDVYSISGSSTFANISDSIVSIYRDYGCGDNGEDITQVHVKKTRQQTWFGNVGVVEFTLDEESKLFKPRKLEVPF